ncbi:class E sortase [Streptomyces sp. HNM0663]|uniref:Class E sortase n=1 Tax=Streptomyces chengmaiensis TaxID=3040919 RepID=A0ABT6HQ90_9ACTN|nr:class E sortase [Streptomyces chengmaiensis]MDH2390496.1 class E sortase [Streptomyces chengmaiensis]
MLWGVAELAVTLGGVVLLLVVHQLQWTNLQARHDARRHVRVLEQQWERAEGAEEEGGEGEGAEGKSGEGESGEGKNRAADGGGGEKGETQGTASPAPFRGYAVLRIPRLGVVAPVARGVGKREVLDRGFVGHYPDTAAPGRAGNFAVAGHRNTHGEPFRRIDRLRKGDEVRIETAQGVYVYEVDQTLAQTTPGDTGVIQPVPRSLVRPSAGYDRPGRYLTLTTCTPEFSSAYRLVVWGELAAVRTR